MKFLSLLALATLGCSSTAPAKSPSLEVASPAKRAEATDIDVLHGLLDAIEAPGALLNALPPAAHKELERQRDALSPEQRQLLLEGSDPVVATRPLLYLAVGGREPSITGLLYSSSAGSSEIVGLLGDRTEYPGLVSASNELARRAALLTLKTRAVDLAPGVEHKSEHLQQVALAARLLDRVDIERLALSALVVKSDVLVVESDTLASVQWRIALAQLEARALNLGVAREHLAKVDAVLARAPQLRSAQAGARALIAGAALVSRAATPLPTLDERVAAARAALDLGLPARARELLARDQAQFGRHLAYSTTLARALTDGNACPAVWPTLVNERLCRQAWAEALPRVSSSELDQAWASGEGRDAWSVESYLGLAYVVPMMYGLDRLGGNAEPSALMHAFDDMRKVADAARSVDEEFRGIALLSRALDAAVSVASAHPGEPTAIAKAERSALLAEGSALATPGAKPWARAAALAVAAIVTQQESTRSVLEGLRASSLGAEKLPLGSLLLWDMLADADGERFLANKSFLGDLAIDLDASAFERSSWLFVWAEAEAHLVPSDASYANLERIAASLSRPEVPLHLRLRAAIDRAGLAACKGDFAAAVALLEPIVSQTPRALVSSHTEQEMLVAATGYLIVVRGLQATGSERADYAHKLQAFLLDVTRASAAPPTMQMWLLMWGAEFEALLQRDACHGRAPCERKIDRQRGADRSKLAEALGERVASLLAHGVLPVGGVQVEFRYLPNGHLLPEIDVTPAFLLAHVPPVVSKPSN